MPQFPFRQPVNTEDSPEQQRGWTPPSYAQPTVESKDAWKPPDYAVATKDDKPSDSLLDKAKKVWNWASSPTTEAPTRFAEKVSKYINPESTTAGIRGKGSAYIEALGHIASDLSSPVNAAFAALSGGESLAAKEGMEGAASALKTGSRLLSVPVTVEGGKQAIKGMKNKDLSEFLSGTLEAGTGALGMRDRVPAESAKEITTEEPPIRQSREIPYKNTVPINQKALPAHTDFIAGEKGILDNRQPSPQPLADKTIEEPDKTNIVADFIKNNPDARMADIEKFISGVSEASKSESTTAAEEPSIRQSKEIPYKMEDAIKKPMVNPFEKPPTKPQADFAFHWPEFNKDGSSAPMYNVKGGPLDASTVGVDTLKEHGIDIPETPPQTMSVKDEQGREIAPPQPELPIRAPGNWDKNLPAGTKLTPTGDDIFKRMGMGIQSDEIPAQKTDFVNPFEKPQSVEDWTPPSYAEETQANPERTADEIKAQSPDDIVEMQGGLGGFKPSKRDLNPSTGPYGAALDKLFNSMGDISEKRVQQDALNKVERAKRFAAFNSVDEVGAKGAAQTLSKLKGEFDKVDLDKLQMTQPQVDSLFTGVKRANITPGEKARGYTTLFKLFNGELPQRNELRVLDDVFGNNFSSRIIEMHGGLGAVGIKLSKLANTAKTMNNMFSLAPALRHGGGFALRQAYAPAMKDMFKFYSNKEFFDASMKAIQEHPDYMKFREAGGFFSTLGSHSTAEEDYLNSYIGDLPKLTGIPQAAAASGRAYTGLLNKLRFDTTTDMFKTAEKMGYKLFTNVDGQLVASKEAKAITRYNNIVSGRGELPFNLGKVTNELNMALWSPRMLASRIQLFTNPKIYTDLPKGMRLDGLKALLGIASIGTAVTAMTAMTGAKISSNILSADFGKSRFGNHVIDPWGSYQQLVVAAARMLAGKTDSSQPTTRLDIAGRFAANKESPIGSFIHSMLTSKFTGNSNDPTTAGNMTTEYGQKTSIQSQVGRTFTPIFVQDLQDLIASEPNWTENIGLTAAMSAASAVGMAQNYPEKKKLSLGSVKLR